MIDPTDDREEQLSPFVDDFVNCSLFCQLWGTIQLDNDCQGFEDSLEV